MLTKFWKKIASFVSIIAILANVFSPLTQIQPVFAQEATPDAQTTATPAPDQTPDPTPTPVVTPLPSPEDAPTPSPTPAPDLVPSPDISPSQLPNLAPTTSPTPSSIATGEATQSGNLSVAVVNNLDMSSAQLDSSPVEQTSSATLTTSQADYSPTGTAIIYGSGFSRDTTYTLVITSSDPPVVNFQTQVTTDTAGSFFYSYQLDGNYRPNYQVQVKDLSGAVLATTTFTDTATMTAITGSPVSISADTTGGSYTSLTGPTITEGATGDMPASGTIILNAPSGFIFNTSQAVTATVTLDAGSKPCFGFTSTTATPTTSTITFTLNATDGNGGNPTTTCHVTFSGIQVRPSSGTPLVAGNITNSGTISPNGSTNYGTLTEVVGAVSASNSIVSASLTSIPANGSTTSTITVVLKDQFGNPVSGKNVTLAKSSGSGSPTIATILGITNGFGQAAFTVKSITAATDVFTATDTTDSNLVITQTASVTFTVVDSTPPTVSSVDSDGQTYNSATSSPHTIKVTFNENISNNPTISISGLGQTVNNCSDLDPKTYCFAYTIPSATDFVTKTITISGAQDGAGNTMGTNSSHTFIVDTTAPTNQNTVFAASVSKVGGASVAIVSSGDTTNNVWFAPSGTTVFVAGATMTKAANGLATTILAPATAGAYKLFVLDAAGNISTASTATLTVDNTAPVITITNPTTSPAQSKTITASTNEGTLTMSNTTGSTCDGTLTFGAYSSQTFTLESNNGTKVCYKAVDTAGNTAYNLSAAIAGIDITPPITNITSATDGNSNVIVPGGLTKSNSIFVAFSAADTSGIASSDCKIDGGVYSACVSPKSYSALSDGSHTVSIRSTDNAGNIESTATFTWTIDTTAPTIPGTPTVTTPVNDNTPAWTWGASTDSGSGLSATPYSVQWCTNSSFTGCGANTATSNINSFTHSVSLADGTWYFKVKATDAAGNQSSYSANGSVIIDTTAPDTTPPTTTDSGIDGNWHNSDVTVTLICNDGSGVGCANTYHTTDGSTPTIGSSTTNPFTLTSDGNYTIKYFSKDNAGNSEAVKTASNAVKIDKTNPTDPTDVHSTSHTSASSNDTTIDMAWSTFSTAPGATDALSGVDGYSYSFTNNAADVPDTTKDAEESITSITSSALTNGTWYFHLRTRDNAGNWTSTVHAGPFVIDTTAPDTTINSGPTGFVSVTSATFTFSANETSTFECQLDGGSFSSCASPKSYISLSDGAHTFQVRATDTAGNLDVTPASGSWTVDSQAPGITYNYPTAGDQTVWYNADPGNIIDVDFIWGSGAPLDSAQRKIGSGAFTNIFTTDQSSNYTNNWGFTWTSLAEGLNQISIKVADTIGNTRIDNYVAGISGFLFRKDTVSPTTADSGIDTSWHNADVIVTLNCSDTTSGCASTYHTIDGSTPTTSSSTANPFTLSSNGIYTIKYFSKDNAGNQESVKTAINTVKIDKTAPTVSADNASASWRTSNVTITLSVSDSLSGLNNARYNWDLPATSSIGTVFANSATINILSEGNHTLYLYTDDNAGNSNTFSGTYKLDTSDPAVSASGASVNWQNSLPAITVSVSDSVSGVASVKYAWDGNASTGTNISDGADLTSTYPGDGMHTLNLLATDNSGRTKTFSGTYNIDRVNPSAPGTPSTTTPTNSTTQNWSWSAATDAVSGIFQYAWRVGGGPSGTVLGTSTTTNLLEGVWNFFVRAIDNAGNQGSESTSTVTVDTTAPQTTIDSGPSGDVAASSASFTFSASSASEAATFECDLDGSGFSTCTSPKLYSGLSEGFHTFQVKATDTAGNVDATPVSRTWTVDTIVPTKPVPSVAAGDYAVDQSVTLNSSDSNGYVIYYTTDGTTPSNTNGTLYAGAITVDHDMSVNAIAYDPAGNASPVMSAHYGIPPVISAEATSSVTDTSITVTWTTDDPATSRVVYGTAPVSDATVATFSSGSNYGYTSSTIEDSTKVTSHSVNISGLSVSTAYFYRTVSHGSPETVGSEQTVTTAAVAAASTSGGGGGSGGGDGSTTNTPSCGDTKPGSAPTLISAVAGGSNQVTLTWSTALNPVTYYLATYGTASGRQDFGNPNIGGAGTTSYTVQGLSGGVTYYFKVRAGNGCTPGDFSNEVSVTTSGGAVSGPAAGFSAGVLGTSTEENKSSGAKVEGTATASNQPQASKTAATSSAAKKAAIALGLLALLAAGAYIFRKRIS